MFGNTCQRSIKTVRDRIVKTILITAVGGDIGYDVIKALKASNREFFIIGCDIRKYNISYDLVDEFLICPSYKDVHQWKAFMLDIIAEKRVEYFWPITEPEIQIVNQNASAFKSSCVIINQTNVLEIAMDKGSTARFLHDNGVPTPQTWFSLPYENVTFPMIVKERFSCGSHSVVIVNNYDEMKLAFCNMNSPIVQEYIGDRSEEYTLTVFSDGSIINSIAFKRELGFGGMSRYVELSHDDKLIQIAERIARLFSLRGSINVQLRKKNEEYYVFEINPRISSTMGFRMLLGFNDASWWIDMMEKRKVEKYCIPRERIYGVRMVEEKVFREY